jgi:myo-inositol-1(or 4)-monophosphatase
MTSFDTASLRARAEVAISVARKVGRAAAAFRAEALPETLAMESKGTQDFVTVADKRAEDAIRTALLGSFPEDAFMGEEAGGVAGEGGTWVVDPIDGTTNYIRGFRHWGVSIAFVAAGDILIGVIYDVTQDKVFHAVRGEGAFKDGTAIKASTTTDPGHAIAILGHSRRTDFEDYLAVARSLYDRGIDYRRMGAAAIGLVRVAEGISDLYYERQLSAWDMLAGILIAREGGVEVSAPTLAEMIASGGPVVACTPGLSAELAFLLPAAGLSPSAPEA